MKDTLTIALPTLMVLVGILLNRSDANRLDARITALESSLRTEMSDLATSLRSEMKDLASSLRTEMSDLASSLRSEMVTLRSQFHNDVLMLLSSDKEQDQRITKLEARG